MVYLVYYGQSLRISTSRVCFSLYYSIAVCSVLMPDTYHIVAHPVAMLASRAFWNAFKLNKWQQKRWTHPFKCVKCIITYKCNLFKIFTFFARYYLLLCYQMSVVRMVDVRDKANKEFKWKRITERHIVGGIFGNRWSF